MPGFASRFAKPSSEAGVFRRAARLARDPPGRAAGASEAASRSRLDLVPEDVRAHGLGEVPALVEGPQLTRALARRLPRGWGVWLVPDPARTALAREQRLAKEQALAGRLAVGRSRIEGLVQRDAVLAARIRRAAARLRRHGGERMSNVVVVGAGLGVASSLCVSTSVPDGSCARDHERCSAGLLPRRNCGRTAPVDVAHGDIVRQAGEVDTGRIRVGVFPPP